MPDTTKYIREIKLPDGLYEIGLGNTESQMIQDLADNVEAVNKEVEENAQVVSASLNDLETRKADKTHLEENYYDKSAIDEKIAGIDIPETDTSSFFNKVEYSSENKKLVFSNNNDVKSEVDATPFIKDGMIENVEVKDKNLEVTFNTDSGKQPISIPLSSIFDNTKYYTKEEIDESEQVTASALNDIEGRKIELSDLVDYTYNKQEIDNKTNIDLSDYYKKSETQELLDNKVDNDEYNNSSQVISASLNDLNSRKANKEDIPDVESFFNDVVYDSASAKIKFLRENGHNTELSVSDFIKDNFVKSATYDNATHKITLTMQEGEPVENDIKDVFNADNYYTKTENDEKLNLKLDKEEYEKDEKVIASSLNDLEERKANKTDIPTDFYTKAESDEKFALKSDIPVPVETYTKQEIDNKLDNKSDKATTLGGYGITDAYTKTETNAQIKEQTDYIDNVIKDNELVISSALNDLETRKADKSELASLQSTLTEEIGAKASTEEMNSGLSQKQDKLTAGEGITINDNTISCNVKSGMEISTNPTITGGAVTVETGKYYIIDNVTTPLTVNLPSKGNVIKIEEIIMSINKGEGGTITFANSDSKDIYKMNNYDISANGMYELNIIYDGIKWVIGAALMQKQQ